MSKTKVINDSFGTVTIPAGALFGKSTARWIEKFGVGQPLPFSFLAALALVKKACAFANRDCGVITKAQAAAIADACDEVIAGKHTDQFPVSIFQSGSGTFTNMNMNEVLAGIIQKKQKVVVHPNDVINRSQSTNDIFPTGMYVSAVLAVKQLLPVVHDLVEAFQSKGKEYQDVIKAGRTHLMDAVPIRLGMEFDAWGTRVQQSEEVMKQSLDQLSLLPVGGTAVGSEINAPQGFAEKTVQYISELSGHPFNVASNKAVAISSHDALLAASSVLSNLAANLISITSTMRWLSSGPRTGLAELMLPGAEPGSSIMPGKVNPSVLEGVQMSYYVVLGNHQVLTLANTHSSELDLNTAKPVMIERFLESTVLLHDACDLLNKKCVRGIKANLDVIKKHLSNTLMTVTALTPAIGYDKATAIAVKALNEGTTLKEAAIALGVAEDLYDTVVVPSKMVAPFTSGIKKVA